MIDDAAFRFAVFAAPRESCADWLELGRSENASQALACAAGFAEGERERPLGYLTVIVLLADSTASAVPFRETTDECDLD